MKRQPPAGPTKEKTHDECALITLRDYTMGTLTVTIKAAKGLLAADRGGKSDPYCKLKLNDEIHETETIKKTVNPVWNLVVVGVVVVVVDSCCCCCGTRSSAAACHSNHVVITRHHGVCMLLRTSIHNYDHYAS